MSACCSNLRGFVATRPPLVVFTCCILALAFATLYLAHYVDKTESVANPDIPLDWNKLLNRMAGLELCVVPKNSAAVSSNISLNKAGDKIISVTAALELTKELHSKLNNNTKIGGPIAASLLGLVGNHSISVSFFMVTNHSNGDHHDNKICATFTGPSSELPNTPEPEQCITGKAIPGERNSQLLARVGGRGSDPDWCLAGTELRLAYHSDSSLTPILTVHDKSVIILHLMHASYFLLVVALTLICYGLLKGRRMSHPHEKVPLGP